MTLDRLKESIPTEEDSALAQALIQRSPNGILVTDFAGNVRLTNPALLRMVPLVPDAIGRPPSEVIPLPAIAEALAPQHTAESEFTVRLGLRELLVRVVPLGPERGRLCVVQDVTRLRQAERYRQEFVANVSHELRTPATSITGFAETLLLDRHRLDAMVVNGLEVILRNARRLTDLFDDLLQLARLDAREERLPLGQVYLAGAFAECADRLSSAAIARKITLETSASSGLWVNGHPEALGHVLSNLVSNAIKYSPSGAMVNLRGRPRNNGVIIEVVDQGIGIDPIHHERIFERFYRVDKGRAREAGGTGLGLAIVKHLVQAMGGTVEVRSRPGRGSTFRVWLNGADSSL